MVPRAIAMLLVALLMAQGWGAEIHLKNGSQIFCRIQEDKADSYVLVKIRYQRGDGKTQVLTDGALTLPKSKVEMVIVDEGDKLKPTGNEPFPIRNRGEEILVQPTELEVPPERPEIELVIPRGPGEVNQPTATSAWRPKKLGEPVEVEPLGIRIALPDKFRSEVVTKGGNAILRVISPEDDKKALGFDIWQVDRRDYEPFNQWNTFFEFTQEEALKALELHGDRVEVVKPRHKPSELPSTLIRDAAGRVYLLQRGEERRHVEVRILRTLGQYFIFVFSTPREMDQEIMPIFDKSFASLELLER